MLHRKAEGKTASPGSGPDKIEFLGSIVANRAGALCVGDPSRVGSTLLASLRIMLGSRQGSPRPTNHWPSTAVVKLLLNASGQAGEYLKGNMGERCCPGMS